jgi:putative lipoic acid-binding regulatory protein
MERHPHPEELLQFPCDYLFKAFGPSDPEGDFTRRVQAAVTRVTPLPLDGIRVRSSSRGTYLCVTAVVRLQNFDQLTAIYAALRQVEGLRYLL